MFLKSMEIRGFKSFADKTELSFKKGVTAVVGPNGSGKSNISDAVRWVLGEQSVKSLRGGKMEDVIFAGTQFRKPVGLAQVALTLDNSDGELPIDYSDVTISRRLYRSGESEYYINNTHCRLKDIHELFMDTGIGKEGYSIIGQGKIDAILSGRPEERRNLLEEAAGIVKFKARKDEAQKRLEATNQNLVRINDILNTYEERLEPLRIDSEKASSFLVLSEQLKIKEVNLIVNSIENIQQRLTDASDGIEKLEKELTDLFKQKSDIKDSLHQENQFLDAHERETEQLNKRYYEDKQLLMSLNSEIELLNERLKNLEIQIERAESEIIELEDKARIIDSSKADIEEDLKSIHLKQNTINLTIVSQEEELQNTNDVISSHSDEIKSLNDREYELVSEISETKNSIVILNSQKEQAIKRNDQIENSVEGFKNSISININTKSLLVLESENIKKRIDQYEEDVKNIKLQANDVRNKLFNQEKNLKEKTLASQRLETNRNVLLNLDKQHEGYNKSSKLLMQDMDKGTVGVEKGSCFILGEIIRVDKHLETAMEISLGGAISDIITPDENTAKKLISYLRDNKLGRATFLPLNILKARFISEKQKLSQIKGFIGVANDLVGFDVRFKSAIDFVLGRTIVSSDMDSALTIARASNYSYRIVTLAGETINPGGSMSGGSLQVKATNIIGRKREIEDLNKEISSIQLEIDEITKSLELNKQLSKQLDENILNLKDSIYAESIEITKILEKISSIDKENEKLKENLNISQSEVSLINNQIDSIKIEVLEKNKHLEQLYTVLKENQARINDLTDILENKKAHAVNIREKLTEKKIEKAQVDETVSNKIKDLERLSKEFEDIRNKKNSLTTFIQESQLSQNVSLSRIDVLKKSILAAEESIMVFDDVLMKNEAKRTELKENISKYESSLEQLSLIISKNEDEKHRFELQLARIETEKEGLYKKLNEEMQMTYAEALEFKVDSQNFSSEGFKKETASIKAQIAALGVINVGAIEEYKEVKEKYGFMSVQRDDLLKSIEELNNVIMDMTEIMKNVFSENFAKLRENFNLTFMELFKGGSADLILGEGDELSANIDINVQPPGKKLQNINLMSGGEKVLSAIALLFAILKMKPTPFCILDEIEAALDDANVFRYAEFLKKFSSNIQFIVITHRKGTMESSDVLYGVTMEEKGVSKIVSVDLSKK